MADIFLAPIVSALTPIIVQVSAGVIAIGIAWGAARLNKATGISIRTDSLDHLTKAAQAEAGALIAAAGDNLATATITVADPRIAAAANRILMTMPDVLKAAGVTPDRVAVMIAGAIGELQSNMTSVNPISSVAGQATKQ